MKILVNWTFSSYTSSLWRMLLRIWKTGTSLVVLWLRLSSSTAGSMGSIPGWEWRSCMLLGVTKKYIHIYIWKTALSHRMEGSLFSISDRGFVSRIHTKNSWVIRQLRRWGPGENSRHFTKSNRNNQYTHENMFNVISHQVNVNFCKMSLHTH